jgi:hypothetical protein
MTSIRLSQVCIAALFLTLLLVASASAQEFRGSIGGRILDPNGAVLPGATVTARNVSTNAETKVQSGDDGSYNFPLLQPGRYTLSASMNGFSTAVRDGIEIR